MSYEYNVPFIDFITSFGENDGADKFFEVNTELEKLSVKETPASNEEGCTEKSERHILREVCENIQNIGRTPSQTRELQILSAAESVQKSRVKSIPENVKTQISQGFSKSVSAFKHKKHFQTVEEVNGELCIINDEIRHAGVPRTIPNQRTKTLQHHSFEERQKLQVRKREEHVKKVLEEEKKKRIFHANPLPSYLKSTQQKSTYSKNRSAVTCRFEVKKSTSTTVIPTSAIGRTAAKLSSSKSTSSLKSNSPSHRSTTRYAFHARPAFVVRKQPFLPQKTDRLAVKPGNVTLHSAERAKARKEFDEKLRQLYKERENEARAKKEKEVLREKEEIAEMRKKLVHKAQPVPIYKSAILGNRNTRPKNCKNSDMKK